MLNRLNRNNGSFSLIMLLFGVAIVAFFYLSLAETYFKGVKEKQSGEYGTDSQVQLIVAPEYQQSFLESTQKKIHDIEKMHQEQADKIMDGFAEENYQ